MKAKGPTKSILPPTHPLSGLYSLLQMRVRGGTKCLSSTKDREPWFTVLVLVSSVYNKACFDRFSLSPAGRGSTNRLDVARPLPFYMYGTTALCNSHMGRLDSDLPLTQP